VAGKRERGGFDPIRRHHAVDETDACCLRRRDTVGAGLSGELNVVGSQDGVTASAVARAYGAILDKEWNAMG